MAVANADTKKGAHGGNMVSPVSMRYGGPAMRCVAPVLAGLGLVAVITAPSAGAKRIGPIDLVSQAGIRIVGEAASDRVGWAVARAGDVNGDRRMDVIIGAPSAGNNGTRLLGLCLRRLRPAVHGDDRPREPRRRRIPNRRRCAG